MGVDQFWKTDHLQFRPHFARATIMNDDPIKRFVLLVLFQAQQDHATELVISSAIGESAPVKYKVDGTWYDMSAPPPHILPDVVAELGRMARLSEGVNKGLIDTDFSGVRLRWSATAASGGSGYILKPSVE
jgi:type II secretory ATPase GspE/PulE/Tfp pilus assembly ATPase PilB-like protein